MPAGQRGHATRFDRRTRWFHGAWAVVTLVLLATGWWLRAGHEGDPSLLARLADRPDTELHRQAGWILVGLVAVALTLGIRGAFRFARETVRIDRGDGHWFRRWPIGAFTGRFAHHRGHFDPGQRLANIGFVATLGTLVVTGIGLTTVKTGPSFVWFHRVHRYATYALIILVAGHILVAAGVLPGYRGAWRSMHLGGRTPQATARRLWPESELSRSGRPGDDR
ncbi:MAG: cytochrome b/b6 domain-containing protein [Acidimicrobiia bacterium]